MRAGQGAHGFPEENTVIKLRLHVCAVAFALAALGLALSLAPGSAGAQAAKPYEPKEYQDGKDVVWVPTAADAGRQDARHGQGHAQATTSSTSARATAAP